MRERNHALHAVYCRLLHGGSERCWVAVIIPMHRLTPQTRLALDAGCASPWAPPLPPPTPQICTNSSHACALLNWLWSPLIIAC
eukprot:scaffold181179_cov33-Tisochrysis_lutea.AAC.1